MNHKFHVTLVRHGETMENRENVIQGQGNTELSDLGRQQASLVASRLQHEYFTHMYSSDLHRAADTAKAIVMANEMSKCPLWLDKRLRERCFGVMEGKKFSELQALMKELCLIPQTYTPEKGESIDEVTKRARHFFNDLCEMVVTSTEEQASVKGQLSVEDQQRASNGAQTSSIASSNSSAGSCGPSDSKTSEPLSVHIEDNVCTQTSRGASSNVEPQKVRLESVEKNILIVSHGLLLRELKRIILDHYKGSLIGEKAMQNSRVSPNTGVSKFTLSATRVGKKVKVTCIECHFINCSDHLRHASQNVVTEAKYQNAV